MQVCFHVGPHKTGTTSVQFLLHRLFGTDEPGGVWYPIGDALGEAYGHGGLATPFRWRSVRYNRDLGLSRLHEAHARATDARVGNLIISSENFSFANNDDLRAIRAIFGENRFRVIFTASPLAQRAVSSWSTSIQFGWRQPLSESQVVLDRYPGFAPDYFSHMIDGLEPDEAELIVSDPTAPDDQLLSDFFAACGLELPPGGLKGADAVKKNPSLGAWEAELLRHTNQLFFQRARSDPERSKDEAVFARSDYMALRRRVLQLTRSTEWTAAFPRARLELPDSYIGPLSERAAAQANELAALVDAGRLAVRGDTAVIFKGLDVTPKAGDAS